MPCLNASLLYALPLALLAASMAAQTPAANDNRALPCDLSQLVVRTDAGDGGFAGMSHDGTLLAFRNASAQTCTIGASPHLSATSTRRLPILFEPEQNAFAGPVVDGKRLPMGHGPVVLPLSLAPGQEATLTLRWVDGPVYDHNVCADVARLTVHAGGRTRTVRLGAHLCGPDRRSLTIKTSRLTLASPAEAPPR